MTIKCLALYKTFVSTPLKYKGTYQKEGQKEESWRMGKYYETLSSRQRMATARRHSQQLWFTCTRLSQSTFHYECERGLWGSTPSHELLATNYCFGKGKSSFFGGTASGRLFIQMDDPMSTSMQVALMKFSGKTTCCQVWSLGPTRRERFLQTVFWPHVL